MPQNAYFHGHGEKVLRQLVKEYGPKKGEGVFYALANKRGQTPKRKARRKT